jgi:hypothetical protein
MCFHRRQLDPKSRRIFAAGNLCLTSGVTLTIFAGGFGHHYPVLYNSLRFLLFVLAIILLRWSARRSVGCASSS